MYFDEYWCVGPGGQFLLKYGSRDTRRIDFPRVDGLSTDTPGLGCHQNNVVTITL